MSEKTRLICWVGAMVFVSLGIFYSILEFLMFARLVEPPVNISLAIIAPIIIIVVISLISYSTFLSETNISYAVILVSFTAMVVSYFVSALIFIIKSIGVSDVFPIIFMVIFSFFVILLCIIFIFCLMNHLLNLLVRDGISKKQSASILLAEMLIIFGVMMFEVGKFLSL